MFFLHYREKKLLELEGGKIDNDIFAKRLNIEKHDLAEINERLYSSEISLYTPTPNTSDWCLQDTLVCKNPCIEDTIERRELLSKVHKILEQKKEDFTPRENFIIFQRMLAETPLTLRDMGKRLNISRERVRQVEAILLKKLRKIFTHELGGDASWAF